MGVACDGLSGNKQMAHSQLVVVIAFSLTFAMDFALVLHGRPLGNVGFHCHLSIAVYHRLFRFVIVCFCSFLICMVAYLFRFASFLVLFFLQIAFIRLRPLWCS